MAPKFVAPYRLSGKQGKNDAADAAAICEAMATPLFVCEQPGVYRMATPEEVRGTTHTILTVDLTEKPMLNSPNAVKDYLRLQIGDLPHEVFSVMFLDSQNRLLAHKQMFRGSLTSTMVYPREVAKRALELSADGVILTHTQQEQSNHRNPI